jgi:hypothetical protein
MANGSASPVNILSGMEGVWQFSGAFKEFIHSHNSILYTSFCSSSLQIIV